MPPKYDYLIVGAGLSGIVLAERLSTQLGKKCLIVEKRNHIGGNCYDSYDSYGILIHNYGPHYFRTNSAKIREYLSQFTDWQPVDYKILSWTGGRYWSFPINLNTFEQLIGKSSSESDFAAYLAQKRVAIDHPKNSEEVIVSQVGWELYEKFFLGYTQKQWRRHPRELDASVCGRIPIRTNRDDRYLNEDFQALPAAGYTKMFERMLKAAAPYVSIKLNTNYRNVMNSVNATTVIYTGPIDEYYDYCYGALPYRSLRFERESFDARQLRARGHISGKPGFWQPALQINYPDVAVPYTRIVEMKHATFQECPNTTIVREFPDDYGVGKEAYYPIPAPDASSIYKHYAGKAALETNVIFTGRLATYRYYNMDQIVGMSLSVFDKITSGMVR